MVYLYRLMPDQLFDYHQIRSDQLEWRGVETGASFESITGKPPYGFRKRSLTRRKGQELRSWCGADLVLMHGGLPP